MACGSLFGLVRPGEARDDVRARPVLDRPADDVSDQQELVLGEFLGDSSCRLHCQSEVLSCFFRSRAALLVGHDPAVEEHAERIARDAGVAGQHGQHPLERELSVSAAKVVCPTRDPLLGLP